MNTPEPTSTYKLTSLNPHGFRPDCITWCDKDNKQIGCLSWEDGVFKFEGKADESAKLFFDYIVNNFTFPKAAIPAPTFAQLYKN